MYNMQAVVRKSINNATMQFEKLGYVANNLANYNTAAYKTNRFEQILREDGYVDGAIRPNALQGSIRISKNPYDVAIDGEGYIPVVSPEGEVAYTRDGAFKQGKDGYLVTTDDWIVGEGIKIPANCYKFEIKPNGEVYSYDAANTKPKKLGTIPLVRFASQENLEQRGMNKLVATADSGDPMLVRNHNCFCQNNIENSNTNIYSSTSDMLRLNASLLASTRMMKVVDDMYNKAINIRE